LPPSGLKQCLGFRKIQKNKAIAEYLGKYPADVQNRHGNAKITNQEYIRTSPVTKRKVRFEIESGKAVKQVFSDNFQSEHQHRDSKFVHNLKCTVNKEINPGNKQNIADDMQNVINMLSNSHPFLKEIVQFLKNCCCYKTYPEIERSSDADY
jgi:hypothetical protein